MKSKISGEKLCMTNIENWYDKQLKYYFLQNFNKCQE